MKRSADDAIQQLCRFAARRSTVLALAALCAGLPTTGHAKVAIEGVVTALRVTTSDDALSDVLASFSTTFNVRYRTSVALDTIINGTYSGSVERVIARLLEGYGFTMEYKGEAIEISVFGRGRGGTGLLSPAPFHPNASPAVARRPAPTILVAPEILVEPPPGAAPGLGIMGQLPPPARPPVVPANAPRPSPTSGAASFSSATPRFMPDPDSDPAFSLGPTVATFSRGPIPPGGAFASDSGRSPAATPPDGAFAPYPTPAAALFPNPAPVAALTPYSSPMPAMPHGPAAAKVLKPTRVPRPPADRLPITEFSWIFPDSSYSRALRVTQARSGAGRQRGPRAADAHVRQTFTSARATPRDDQPANNQR
jgi:hypothetical protein